MDFQHAAILVAAGIGGGALSSVIGGASIVTFPALIAAGLPPLSATVCNIAATTPGVLVAALADRKQLPPVNRAFAGLVLMSFFGAALGSALLLLTPQKVFTLIVPLLLGFATILFMLANRISLWMRERAQRRGREVGFSVTSLKILFPVSFYGGYFGAGVGIMLLGVLSIATGGDYRSANATKNLVGVFNNLAATAVFMTQSAIFWPQTLTLMAGTVMGGLLGAWVSRVLPKEAARVLVITAGSLLTVIFAWRYWF